MKIEKIEGFELLDSRSNPTVAAKVTLKDGSMGFAMSPSGASTGSFEAYELRDNDKKRYCGKGTLMAAANISGEIAAELEGEYIFDQRRIDKKLIELDGTENKSRLGANAILAVSLATAKAAANSLNIPLYRYIGGIHSNYMPRPMMNILNGGAHAANNIDIQEFMIVPTVNVTFSEKVRICSEIYHALGKILKEKNLLCGVGDEGGYAPMLESDEHAIELITTAIDKAGYDTGKVKIALDIASSEWYEKGTYHLPKRNVKMSAEELMCYYEELIAKYPIISLEDALAEDDFENWKKLTARMGNKLQLVGDDLFVTNIKRLEKGIDYKAGNAILVKPNQIGTLTETVDVVLKAKQNSYATILSHRSGETEDTTIADIAVGLNAMQIKTGAPCRTDRVAKYNRLMMIERQLGY
ncbi:MAG: phosphopyruvate hydratase [Clostridia bacterium]|nr:phosphopyruvate hydratase [Clostridia bacterium]